MAETSSEVFVNCRYVAKIEICSSNIVSLNTALNYHSCLHSMINPTLGMITQCSYEIMVPEVVQTTIVDRYVFVTLHEIMPTRVECGKNHSVISTLTFYVDSACNVVNQHMRILGTRSHDVNLHRNKSNYVQRYDYTKFASLNVSLINRLEPDLKNTIIISQDTLKVMIPSITVTLIVFLLICIIIILYLKLCKPKLPKVTKKDDSEKSVKNLEKEAAKWIAAYIREHPRVGDNPYRNRRSRRNITPVISFDD